MTLASTLRQKLTEAPAQAEPHEFQVVDAAEGASVRAAVLKSDGLSVLVSELNIRRAAPPAATVREWAGRVAERVTSLLEPLQVLEIDASRNQAMLRTKAEAVSPANPMYFEVILEGTTSAGVRRFQAAAADQPGSVPRREPVPFALTHEGLVKLVADILA